MSGLLRRVLRRGSVALWAIPFFVASVPLHGQAAGAQPTDTAALAPTRGVPIPLFTRRDVYVVGGFALATLALARRDREYVAGLQQPEAQANHLYRDAAAGFEILGSQGALAVGVATYAVGRAGGYEAAADIGLHGTEAILLSAAVGGLIKGTAGRIRPDAAPDAVSDDFQFGRGFRSPGAYSAFPSGHTAAAFAAAAVATAEAARRWPRGAWIVAPVMYGGASFVGLSRMYDNKHWPSDVVAGAGIGTIVGLAVVRYHHSRTENRIHRMLLPAAINPTADGITVVWSWTAR